jgi:hypothetical protein
MVSICFGVCRQGQHSGGGNVESYLAVRQCALVITLFKHCTPHIPVLFVWDNFVEGLRGMDPIGMIDRVRGDPEGFFALFLRTDESNQQETRSSGSEYIRSGP